MAEPRGDRKLRDVTYLDGIEVKPVYGPADLAGLDYARDLGDPGEYPFTRGHPPPHVPLARVDDAAVRRLRDAGGDERALQVPHGPRPGRAQRRLRPADAARARLRRPARRGRGGPGRHGDRLAPRHGGGVRRHRRRPGVASRSRSTPWRPSSRRCSSWSPRSRASPGTGSSPRPRTTSSRSSSPAGRGSIRSIPRSAWSATSPSSARGTRRGQPHLGLRLPHPRGRVHARPGDGLRAPHRRRLRRAPGRRAACPSTSSRRASRSTSRAGAGSSRRSRSSAPAAGSTRG